MSCGAVRRLRAFSFITRLAGEGDRLRQEFSPHPLRPLPQGRGSKELRRKQGATRDARANPLLRGEGNVEERVGEGWTVW